MLQTRDPHHNARVIAAGEPLQSARAALILVHGRGATAESILTLAPELDLGPEWALLAPQAAGNTWYPLSFLAPIDQNEPHLSSALALLGDLVQRVVDAGIPPERLVLAGFSQGACLVSEFAARHARRYGGVIAFSGGLIGPPGTPRDDAGAFDDTPAFFGCSDIDPHIPQERVIESAQVYERLGAQVDARLYPGMGHTVNADEIAAAREIVRGVLGE